MNWWRTFASQDAHEHDQRRSRTAFAVSFALHLVAAFILLRPPLAIFVKSSPSAAGLGGRSYETVYLSAPPAAQLVAPRKTIYLGRREPKLSLPHLAESRHRARNNSRQPQIADSKSLAGSILGTVAEGSWHDVRPALPLVFPDPEITRSTLPPGVTGEVIVEVTIDKVGNVIDTRLLQGMGYGIEEKVLAILSTWHFRPAMQDGQPIASKQDVHFHLPT
jgi:TonB family protein